MNKRPELAVMGAGAVGMSTAILARRAGYDVVIYSAEDPAQTTSAKAAASFKPHEVKYDDRTHEMVDRSWSLFSDLVQSFDSDLGVKKHTHWEASSVEKGIPPYSSIVENFCSLASPQVPGGYAFGWRYDTFFIDMSVYLKWLQRYLEELKIDLLKKNFVSRDEIEDLPQDTVVNCTGLGSSELFADEDLIPIKGQIVTIGPRKMDWSISADGFYVYPRRSETVLGGTTEWNVATEDVDSAAVELILRGNKRILPDIDQGSIHSTYAGLRPYRRSGVRIEVEETPTTRIVHNYGHGGSGITLSWGSAETVIDLLRR